MKILATLSLLFAFGCAPNGETPGIRLGGSISAVPESFAFLKDTQVIQLEARGFLLPRVVNIWGVGFDNAIYVWSDIGSGWSKRVTTRPNRVRVRVGNEAYEVSATRVTDPDETKRVAHAYQAKYAKEMVELYGEVSPVEDFEVLFRLARRN